MYLVSLIDDQLMVSLRIRDAWSELGEFRVKGEAQRKAGDQAEPLTLGIYACDTIELAREMARYCVRQRPALSAYISKVEKQVVAEVPKPIFKTVNENGVVPE
jgi:hypothetical protein